MATEHAADEAGGEVVYSSDGLAALPRPPAIPAKASEGSDGLDTKEYSAEEAFEVFSGKVYPSEGGSNYKLWQESPLQRLGRLQRELAELEQDVASDDSAVQTAVQDLKSRLQKTKLSNQQELTQKITSSVNQGTTITTPPAAVESTSDVDLRLKRLEEAIGSSRSSEASLMDRLTRIEESVAKLDDTQLEALTKKAKVIRQDLEAATKARNKLMSSLSRSEDSKSITELYDQMVQLQGLSSHLPALTQRLQVLAHQHQDSATWATRLRAMEEAANSMQSQMTTLEQALDKMQLGLQENTFQMAENMKALDTRIQQLK